MGIKVGVGSVISSDSPPLQAARIMGRRKKVMIRREMCLLFSIGSSRGATTTGNECEIFFIWV